MKKLCLCVAATLAMVSCIPVGDFGTYWNKGVVDPALEGTWRKVRRPGQAPEESNVGPDELRFMRTGSSYSMYVDGDAQARSVRTLRVGKRRLLMDRSRERRDDNYLWGYEVHGRTLSEYWCLSDAVVEFLRTRHPDAKNIHQGGDMSQLVKIGTFDDEVFRILSEFADKPAYWILMRRYEKASN